MVVGGGGALPFHHSQRVAELQYSNMSAISEGKDAKMSGLSETNVNNAIETDEELLYIRFRHSITPDCNGKFGVKENVEREWLGWEDAFTSVLKQLSPTSHFASDGLAAAMLYVSSVSEGIIHECKTRQKAFTTVSNDCITVDHLKEAAPAVLAIKETASEVLKFAISEGVKAVTKFQEGDTTGGLQFKHVDISAIVLTNFGASMTADAAVFFTALLEYIAAEVTELSINDKRDEENGWGKHYKQEEEEEDDEAKSDSDDEVSVQNMMDTLLGSENISTNGIISALLGSENRSAHVNGIINAYQEAYLENESGPGSICHLRESGIGHVECDYNCPRRPTLTDQWSINNVKITKQEERFDFVRVLYQIRKANPKRCGFLNPSFIKCLFDHYTPAKIVYKCDERGDHYSRGECICPIVDGKATGYGYSVYPSCGDQMYLGDLVDGKRHGTGKLFWPSLDRAYIGGYYNDQKHGKGKFSFPDGSYFEGEYEHGKKHGKGKYVSVGDYEYEGDHVHGERTGNGVMKWQDGSEYIGGFYEGEPHGIGKRTNPKVIFNPFTGKSERDGKVTYGRWVHGNQVA